MNKLRCLALLVGGFMAGADTQAQTINAFIPTNDELQGMNFYATKGTELFDDGTYPHTPFLETAITEQDAVVEANQKAGDGAGGASRQFHRLTATGEYTDTIGQALAVMLMRPSAATGGSIMKTAEHMAAEMAPALLSQPEQQPEEAPLTFTDNITVVSPAPMITKRAWWRITSGSALTAASVFLAKDASRGLDWTWKFALGVAGGAITEWLGEVPDNDRMAREYVVAIAACAQLSKLKISEFVDRDRLAMACPGVSRPQTQEAEDIGTETIKSAYFSASKGVSVMRTPPDEADDGLRTRFVRALRVAADELVR